jgi:hypothetical protein
MNQYAMSHLADDHRRQLTAEAEQHRMAQSLVKAKATPKPAQHASRLRTRLKFILGRTPA